MTMPRADHYAITSFNNQRQSSLANTRELYKKKNRGHRRVFTRNNLATGGDIFFIDKRVRFVQTGLTNERASESQAARIGLRVYRGPPLPHLVSLLSLGSAHEALSR